MSAKGTLTRSQVVSAVGEDAVKRVEAENCDFTNRLQCDGDERVEFSATVGATDAEGNSVRLVAFYYQTQAALAAAGDDLSSCDWTVEGYDVV